MTFVAIFREYALALVVTSSIADCHFRRQNESLLLAIKAMAIVEDTEMASKNMWRLKKCLHVFLFGLINK